MITGGLSLERSGNDWASGTLEHTITIGEASLDVELELSFALAPAEPPLAPRVVEGADSKPSRQFEKMVQTWMAGDFEGVKELTAAELRGKMEEIDPAGAGRRVEGMILAV